MALVLIIRFQLGTVDMIEPAFTMFGRIHINTMTIDMMLVMILSMVHQSILVTVLIDMQQYIIIGIYLRILERMVMV